MSVPHLLPDEPLPRYAYVPGRHPHPLSDPLGHSFGQPAEVVAIPDPEHWDVCRPFLRGLDLFNHGFYWEAHEAWESVWHACGRHGVMADFFKALIKLAAAGVKIREGRPRGALGHARRAIELFERVRKDNAGRTNYFGLDLMELPAWVEQVAARLPVPQDGQESGIVFGFTLVPRRPSSAGSSS